MSCNYAEGLSPYENKGRLGAPEKFDNPQEVEEKVSQLAEWVKKSKHIVVYTGAGISTSAGIPDFRGPKGVWTLEKKGLKPDVNVSWDDAKPTLTHMALASLVEADRVKYIISQNIDGLHLRSGVPRPKLSELHGNMFADQCDKCKQMVVRDSPAPTVGEKYTGQDCPAYRTDGRKCRGKLRDFVLDWEANLPDADLTLSDTHSMMADLSIVMGSTLQIIPAGNMPTYTKKYQKNGKLVICNLQPTKHAKKADLNIFTYIDDIMRLLMKKLDLKITDYNPAQDPIRRVRNNDLPESGYIDWTQSPDLARSMKKIGDEIHDNLLKTKREEKKRKYLDAMKQTKMKKREEDEADEGEECTETTPKADHDVEPKLEKMNGTTKNYTKNETKYKMDEAELDCSGETPKTDSGKADSHGLNGTNGVKLEKDSWEITKYDGEVIKSEPDKNTDEITETQGGQLKIEKTEDIDTDTKRAKFDLSPAHKDLELSTVSTTHDQPQFEGGICPPLYQPSTVTTAPTLSSTAATSATEAANGIKLMNDSFVPNDE